MNDFAKRLTEWYETNKRKLPWRETNDPYAIWLSEIILQQTRVNQGLPYYQRFIKTWPTVDKLAAASKDEVFKLWQGLGYYRRAENMMKTAQIVVNDHKGIFPGCYHQLLKLPGVGEYTAAAIASIAFGEKVPVTDGNVYRVLSRIFGIKTAVPSSKAKKTFGEKMLLLTGNAHPGTFNQAVMEFGALQCTPSNPSCSKCVFSNRCHALIHNEIHELPVIKQKNKKRKLFICYFVVQWNGHLILHHRTKNEIWKGLYDFPSQTFDKEKNMSAVLKAARDLPFLPPQSTFTIKPFDKTYRHQLTHMDITARFIEITVNNKPVLNNKSLKLIHKTELAGYPVSRLTERFLNDKSMFSL